ncbi:hypothetical protein [Fictibacillus phosphorivorans]|uniref:hypothetical protein n=1 Tax=Fictibacillus phosphorivorans TaxID=1221500 RepID=UPI0012933EB5|nr:hypothetical protein [Fictibacillus phosphorivorans]MQR93707.1 hypothetical protein [Fictibacillus phosphorivorans]
MKFYKCGQKWVIGVEGGVFENLISEPEALICNIEPEPVMMWKTPLEKSNNPFKKESWEFSYVFRKFQVDNGAIYTLEVEKTRVEPGHIFGVTEIFVTEEYVMEKINDFRSQSNLAEYKWNKDQRKWIELERGFIYEDEEIEV